MRPAFTPGAVAGITIEVIVVVAACIIYGVVRWRRTHTCVICPCRKAHGAAGVDGPKATSHVGAPVDGAVAQAV